MLLSPKQIVKYRSDLPCGVVDIYGQRRAILTPIDHPDRIHVTNSKSVTTSRVVDVTYSKEEPDKNPVIETLNSIYYPDNHPQYR